MGEFCTSLSSPIVQDKRPDLRRGLNKDPITSITVVYIKIYLRIGTVKKLTVLNGIAIHLSQLVHVHHPVDLDGVTLCLHILPGHATSLHIDVLQHLLS